MTRTITLEEDVETTLEPCPTCGAMDFNPRCPDCREVRDECWHVESGVEGIDL
ncbi:MAG: hypothetical protein ACE145_05915 [Terriglobia bacterium]